MVRRLDRYAALAREFGVSPTWPTTACVLARRPEVLKRYADHGIELALHGLVHGDHSMLDEAQQREAIARALDVFARSGITAVGFRGPYLRYNEATLGALRDLGLRYHSSQAVVFPLVEGMTGLDAAAPAFKLALGLYDAVDARYLAVRPKLHDGLVDIPVAIPDDEILVERLHTDEAARIAQWLHILGLTHTRGDLFTIQLHPERLAELEAALRATLTDARSRRPAVWIARLDEIAAWWIRRSRFSLHVTRVDPGRFHVRLQGDRDAALLVRELDVPRARWCGRDAIAERSEFTVEAPRIPMVSVSRRSPAAVARFLTEEGLPFEVSDDSNGFGAHVDIGSAAWTDQEVLRAIDAGPGPLVRIWRWPAGARSALAVTGDIDALTLADFALRSWETRRGAFARRKPS
jgi:peptidoglycan/xylan/chitin deacetylase (PgdA/CDA1 family)